MVRARSIARCCRRGEPHHRCRLPHRRNSRRGVGGADAQVQSIDSALSGLNQMAASLRETATQADSVTLDRRPCLRINEVAAVDRTGHEKLGEPRRIHPTDRRPPSRRATLDSERDQHDAGHGGAAREQVTASMARDDGVSQGRRAPIPTP